MDAVPRLLKVLGLVYYGLSTFVAHSALDEAEIALWRIKVALKKKSHLHFSLRIDYTFLPIYVIHFR